MNNLMLSNVIQDPLDSRDYLFDYDSSAIIPESVDLRPYCSTIEDQQTVGSCTANATCSAAEMFLKSGDKFADMSRLFNYFTSRSYLGAANQQNDQGSNERVALKAARNFGIPQETTWPYIPAQWNTIPSIEAYSDALNHKAEGYYRIPNDTTYVQQEIEYAVAKGFPVLVGMYVGARLRTLKADEDYGHVNNLDNPLIGGHELLVVGYDKDYFIMQNSWGVAWGDGGYFRCVKSALIQDSLDIWVLMGFAGVEKVGEDVTIKTVPPEPTPPPEPIPVLPEPIKNNSKKDYTGYVILGIILVIAVSKFLGMW